MAADGSVDVGRHGRSESTSFLPNDAEEERSRSEDDLAEPADPFDR